jgi:Mrp family chromosome partitioning ATPase
VRPEETYLATLRQHRWAAIGIVAVTLLAGVLVSSLAPRRYDATAKIVLGQQQQVDAVLGTAQTSADPERDLNTSVALIGLDTIAAGVRTRLRTDESPDALLAQVTTAVDGTSDIVSITARDADPERAAAIANAFAVGYQQFRARSDQAAVDAALTSARNRLSVTPAGPDYDALAAQVRRLQVAAAFQTGGVQIVRPAVAPTSPSRPRPLLSAVVAGLLGLLLAAALIVFKARTDPRVRTERDLERALGRPLLAAVPGGRGRRKRQAAQEALMTAAARLSHGSRLPRVILVASPGRDEGTAEVALGLAAAFAALGRRSIAIEADLRRPTFCERLGQPPSGGLAALVRDGGSVERELVELEPNAHGAVARVLPAGRSHGQPHTLLASPGMDAVVAEARWRADVLLLAAAPTDAFGDALTLARLADGAVLVARLGATRADAAARALEALDAVDTKILGVVAVAGSGGIDTPVRERAARPARRKAGSPTEDVGAITASEAAA